MNILGLLDQPTAGSYRFEGRETAHLGDDERSRLRGQTIGFVFQRFHLIPSLDILSNVELPMRYQRAARATWQARATDLLQRVGLGHRLRHRPNQLSGGEQQRVAIARSLVNRPRVLLADEPTGNLDTAAHASVMALFGELRAEMGLTVILGTHDPAVGRAAERCVEVVEGAAAPAWRRPLRKACLCLLLLAAGCDRAPRAPAAESKRAEALAERGFYGTITPQHATRPARAPNVFRMKGWNSRSTWIKLVDVVPDGTRIEAGKEIARFEFSNEEALPWIKKRVAETAADLESARARNAEEARQLGSSAAVKHLASESADLDTGKVGLVSDRDLSLLKLAATRARAEEGAARELQAAAGARAGAELLLFDARADDWRNSIERYNAYERRTHDRRAPRGPGPLRLPQPRAAQAAEAGRDALGHALRLPRRGRAPQRGVLRPRAPRARPVHRREGERPPARRRAARPGDGARHPARSRRRSASSAVTTICRTRARRPTRWWPISPRRPVLQQRHRGEGRAVKEGFVALSEGLVQLRGSPLRTLLTLLGVVFGVGSVVSMVSIGEGAQRQILSSIEAMGATSLHVQSAVSKDQSLSDLVNVSVGLSQADALALEKALGVEQAVAARAVYTPKVSSLPIPAAEIRVVGITASVFDPSRLRLQKGRRLSIWDERQASATAVLGSALAERLFAGDAVGKCIRLDYAWFQIVDVLAPQEGGEGDGPGDLSYDKGVIIPYPPLRELLEPPRTYGDLDRISIRMGSIEETLPCKARRRSAPRKPPRRRHRLRGHLPGGAAPASARRRSTR